MIDTNTPEIKFAMRAVRQAAQLVQQIQSEMVHAHLTKEDLSPVTVADFASQALIASQLATAFPNDPLVAEEDAAALRSAESKETLDVVTQYVARFIPQADRKSPRLDRLWRRKSGRAFLDA
jgi:3'(2'), 5'-bisphosphate nucleotidase